MVLQGSVTRGLFFLITRPDSTRGETGVEDRREIIVAENHRSSDGENGEFIENKSCSAKLDLMKACNFAPMATRTAFNGKYSTAMICMVKGALSED